MSTLPADRAPATGPDLPHPTVTCAFAVTDTPPRNEAVSVTPGHDGGGPLRVLAAGPLYLLVQDVPAAAFGEEALAERLNRPDELERCARAHHRGVETAASAGPVVPLPMATLYLDDHNAVRAVTARAASLRTLLDRLRNRTEWAVKVHGPGTGHASGAAGDGPADGRSYLRRVSERRRSEREERERALARAHAVDRELRRYAVAATRHRPQSEQLTGRSVPQLLNAAYLVDDRRRAEFVRAVGELARDAHRSAVEVTLSGPWIPYSFARSDEAERVAQQEAGA
ncbi:GvpL/GvpF family gas vesicle protein [Streptomyces tuirus]|uniref:Gas vesicle protein n=1 Tax=Streptomyces tuirus TaxID=68278 RepID=A0A7G1NS05_9ACTN|nr:GvpL/GvpF family gas vesicle protein [Streptomyces tuirus]BCL24470.1 gas vesicle protein [Streptomyces tuirus]